MNVFGIATHFSAVDGKYYPKNTWLPMSEYPFVRRSVYGSLFSILPFEFSDRRNSGLRLKYSDGVDLPWGPFSSRGRGFECATHWGFFP